MKISIIFLVLMGLTACEDAPERAKNMVEYIHYSQDTRTGFCFAFAHPGSGAGVMSHVPCTPEVLNLLGK